MANDTAIIDFGSGKITVLKGSRGVNGAIILSGSGEAEYAGFMDGEWLRPEQLCSAVEKAITAAESDGQKIKNIFIGVPADFSVCVTKEAVVTFKGRKRVNDDDVERLLSSCAEEANGYTLINRQPVFYNPDDNRRVIDPVSIPTKSLSGLISLIYAENKFLSYVDNIMRNLGIETAEYVSAPLAQALFLTDEVTRDKQAVLIDVGYISSSVAVVSGDGLLSLSSFSLGGGHIAGDLNRYFSGPFAESEALKRKAMLSLVAQPDDVYDIKGKEFEADLVNKIICARITLIAKAVAKSLESCPYEVTAPTLYLTGGGLSYMQGAKEFLGQMLGREVEVINSPLLQHPRHELTSPLGLLDMVLGIPPVKKKKGFFATLFGGKD